MEWRKIIGSPFCDLPPGQKHVLSTMARYGDKWGDHIFPSQREVAFRAGVTPKCVTEVMQRAEREGWIIRWAAGARQGYKRHTYQLAVPADVLDATALLKSKFWEPRYEHELVRENGRVKLKRRTAC